LECWMLHGAVGMAADWQVTAKALAGCKISSRAVDLWRFLECMPMPLDSFPAALHAESTAGAVTKKQVLLGYSMGGRLALHALLEPDAAWSAAIIVAAHPGLEDERERESRRATDAVWASRALSSPWTEFLEAWDGQTLFHSPIPRPPGMAHSLAMRRREIARSFVDWSLGAQEPLWKRMGSIQIPVLWICGEHDEKFRQLGDRAVSLMQDARLAIAPGAGHRVPWENPEWFHREVLQFLKDCKLVSCEP
jgi:2-succinyl-6-hydroxy-2,4-cyclohexadiene-1-carboxylate synthase